MILNKEKILVFNAQAVDGLGIVLFIKVSATFLSKDDFGMYLLVASIVSFISTYFSVIDQGFIRRIANCAETGEFENKFATVLLGHFFMSSTVGLVLYFLYTEFVVIAPFENIAAMLGLSWLILNCMKNVSMATTNILRDRKRFLIAKTIEHLLKVLILLLIAQTQGLSIENLFAAIVASSIVCTIYLLTARFKVGISFQKIDFSNVYVEALKFSWPLMIWASFSWLHVMGSRWIVGFYMGSDAVANFGIITSLSTMPVSILIGLISAYTLPILYQKNQEALNEVVGYLLKIASVVVAISLMIYISLLFFSDYVITIFANERYAEHSYLLPHMYMAMTFNSIGVILGYKSYVLYQTSKLIVANIVPGIVNMILAIVLVPIYGLDGAGIAFIISNVLFCILNIYVFLQPTTLTLKR